MKAAICAANAHIRTLPAVIPSVPTVLWEGYGIFVSELAKQAGIRYNNDVNTVTYFGGLVAA